MYNMERYCTRPYCIENPYWTRRLQRLVQYGVSMQYRLVQYIQINTWAFPYWPGYHPETPILARDGVEGQYESRDDNQANMAMPMY
jgi:hypothetical protein